MLWPFRRRRRTPTPLTWEEEKELIKAKLLNQGGEVSITVLTGDGTEVVVEQGGNKSTYSIDKGDTLYLRFLCSNAST